MVTLQHKHQEKSWSCGATCYSLIVNCDEKTAIKECNTKSSGTYAWNVSKALKDRGINSSFVTLNTTYNEYYKWLNLNSRNRKLYLSCEFINSCGGRGRYSRRHHAILASNGFIYDPSENEAIPIECYFHLTNKELKIKSMVMIDEN